MPGSCACCQDTVHAVTAHTLFTRARCPSFQEWSTCMNSSDQHDISEFREALLGTIEDGWTVRLFFWLGAGLILKMLHADFFLRMCHPANDSLHIMYISAS